MSAQAYFEIDAGCSQRSRIDVRLGNLRRLNEAASDDWHERTAAIVSDENVFALYGQTVLDQLGSRMRHVEPIILPPGETTKSPERLMELWSRFAAVPLNRDSWVVVLGGGVVGDLGGFAAATYARGLPWINVPTTLMAQVDSAIGGKVGINLPEAKNLVGSFWMPPQVIIDPSLLTTLPDREFLSGLAEVVKYAVIQGEDAFEQLVRRADLVRERNPDAVFATVAASCQVKSQIVQADFLEQSGTRALLNYGHTFGHAIEQSSGYGQWTHGEAVAIGMTCAARLAERMRLADNGFCERQTALLQKLGLPTGLVGAKRNDIARALMLDKKNRGGKLQLVLPAGFGKLNLVPGVELADAIAALPTS